MFTLVVLYLPALLIFVFCDSLHPATPPLTMVAQVATPLAVVNGTKANGKQIKSKNQLRREKAKQKKAQQPSVRPQLSFPLGTTNLVCFRG